MVLDSRNLSNQFQKVFGSDVNNDANIAFEEFKNVPQALCMSYTKEINQLSQTAHKPDIIASAEYTPPIAEMIWV